jgi:hypothetical protein
MNIGKEGDAVAHWHRDIVVAGHRMTRFGEIAIGTTGGLQTVELTLTGFDP